MEDDLSLIEGLKYTLEKNGFQVDNARTVKAAYQFFQAGRYDLLLLDVTLPDGTGFDESIGMAGYTAVDIQLADSGSDEAVSAIRSLLPPDSTIADKRLSNSESQSSYYTGAVFIYGFLFIIALITVFNIFNSMNANTINLQQ